MSFEAARGSAARTASISVCGALPPAFNLFSLAFSQHIDHSDIGSASEPVSFRAGPEVELISEIDLFGRLIICFSRFFTLPAEGMKRRLMKHSSFAMLKAGNASSHPSPLSLERQTNIVRIARRRRRYNRAEPIGGEKQDGKQRKRQQPDQHSRGEGRT